MDSTSLATPKFDPVRILTQAFAYVKHLRLMAILFALSLLAGICYFLYSTPLYQARSLVFFQAFGSPVRDADVPETATVTSRASRALMERIRSQEIQIAAAKRLGLMPNGGTFEELVELVPSVRVAFIDARNLEVTVQAYSPEVVRNFTEALVAEFQEIQKASWKEFRDDAIEHYALQLTELEKKVAENVDSLTTMERDSQFTEVTIEQQNLLQIPKELVETRERLKRMAAIRGTLARYEAEAETGEGANMISILSLLSRVDQDTEVEVGSVVRRSFTNSRTAATARNETDVSIVTPSDVEGMEPWRDLEKRKRLIETQIEEASTTYLPEHPRMKELVAERDSIEQALKTEMLVLREKFELEQRRLEEKVTQLEARIPEYQKITEELGRSSVQYSSIEQAQMMWDRARDRLAEKLATVSFSEEFDWVQLRFKGHTSLRDQEPISPNKKKLVMLSLLLGLASAIGVPTILNLLNNSATSLSQLEEYIGIKGIGIVPLANPEFLEAVHRSPAQGATLPNYLLECFRVIRANIGLDASFDGIQSQVILITSARPQEGKSTQAANLAWAYHSMGEKVLLIDCDLRRGRQHAILGLDNRVGMSGLLMDHVHPDEAIMLTAPGSFDAIPRGPIIAGSTELLCQEGFFKQIQAWRKVYDRILLDCPPVLGLSESSSLQRLADGIVLVVRSERTPMKDVRDTVNLLRKAGAYFFGFVLNGVDLSKMGNYYQYYYYSAPYYDQFEEDPEETAAPSRSRTKAGSAGGSGRGPRPPRSRRSTDRERDMPDVAAAHEPDPAPESRPRPPAGSLQGHAIHPVAAETPPGSPEPGRSVNSHGGAAPSGPGDWSDSSEDRDWIRFSNDGDPKPNQISRSKETTNTPGRQPAEAE